MSTRVKATYDELLEKIEAAAPDQPLPCPGCGEPMTWKNTHWVCQDRYGGHMTNVMDNGLRASKWGETYRFWISTKQAPILAILTNDYGVPLAVYTVSAGTFPRVVPLGQLTEPAYLPLLVEKYGWVWAPWING